MQVSEIMTRDPETIPPDASLQQAAAAMEALGVGSLPVCDGERLVGAITDRDIVVRGVAAGLSPVDGLVRECMTEDIAYAYCDEEADEVLERMKTLQVRRPASWLSATSPPSPGRRRSAASGPPWRRFPSRRDPANRPGDLSTGACGFGRQFGQWNAVGLRPRSRRSGVFPALPRGQCPNWS